MTLEISKKLQNKPNPNAKIGFVIFYPFHFFVYKNIFKHLKDDAEFIIDLGAFYPVRQPEGLLEEIVHLFKANNAPFRILYYEDYRYGKYLENFCSQYELLVSLWYRGCIKLPGNKFRKKVSLNYGAGKALNTFRISQRKWDLYLAYGKYDHDILKLYTQCKIVGNPKFDDWFNGQFDEELIAQVAQKLDPGKKTILYLPTHSDLCSIDDIAEELKRITKTYNVIVKLHYYTPREEPERVLKLQHPKIICFNDDVDLLSLLKIADVVLSDNSSAIFDAILADKPLTVTDFLSEDFLDVKHKETKYYPRGKAGALTYSGSIEQRVKKEGLVITFQKPKELESAVDQALQDSPFFRDSREKLRDELFAFQDGKCGERAAAAIGEFLNTQELPERPILYHVLEAFEASVGKRSLSKQKKDTKTIIKYKELLSEKIEEENGDKIIFSVILYAADTEKDFLRMSLRSVLGQEFPVRNFEIIVISKEPRIEIEAMIRELPSLDTTVPNVGFIEARADSQTGALFNEAINLAQGDIICFTRGNCLVPSDWLSDFFLTYQRYPEIGGVGGYTKKYSKSRTSFDEYYHLELARKLNIHRENYYLTKLFEVKNNLFSQNPAGTLGNISYKKNLIKDLLAGHPPLMLESIELELKKRVLDKFEICFIPSKVLDFEVIDFYRFMKRNFREGIAFYTFSLKYVNLKRYIKNNFLSPSRTLLFISAEGYGIKRIAYIFIFATLFRLFGSWYAYILLKFLKRGYWSRHQVVDKTISRIDKTF